MWKRTILSVVLTAFVGISIYGCGTPILAKKEETKPSPPLAKVMAPETKKEIPVLPEPQQEIKKEVLPPSVPVPAPKKKKKG